MSQPSRPSSTGAHVAFAAAAVLLVVGAWGAFVREVGFGRTSSTPLVPDVPRTVVPDIRGMLFLAALVVGTALVAAAAGYLLARRTPPPGAGPLPRR